jgi:nitrate reductase molybdenum cofactor assembly chaperone NarJ/NarW
VRGRTDPAASLPDETLSVAWQCASLLIGYPDEELLGRAGLVREASGHLPDEIGAPLRRFLDHLERTPLTDLAVEYVETFDHRKRCCLFLTYFANGDTRKRGMALLRFKQVYQEAGLVLTDEELPDHLAVVLEFGATADRAAARQLLLDHRAGLELVRMSLRDSGSPWAGVIEAVCATLPRLRGDERDAVLRLATEGPPDEEVGLAPYGTPTLLPTPIVPPRVAANAAGGQ